MRGHRTTDPICHYHREPVGWLSRRRYDRARGKSCDLCMRVRAAAANPRNAGRQVWRDGLPDQQNRGQ